MLFEVGFRVKFLKVTSETPGIIAVMVDLVNRLSDYLIIQLCFPYCTRLSSIRRHISQLKHNKLFQFKLTFV